jgi:hypothetical protein
MDRQVKPGDDNRGIDLAFAVLGGPWATGVVLRDVRCARGMLDSAGPEW